MAEQRAPGVRAVLQQAVDLIDRAASQATGDWQAYFTVHGDPMIVPADRPWPTSRIADISTAATDYGLADCVLIGASGPRHWRAVAATLRAVLEMHAPEQDDEGWPVLAAVLPLAREVIDSLTGQQHSSHSPAPLPRELLTPDPALMGSPEGDHRGLAELRAEVEQAIRAESAQTPTTEPHAEEPYAQVEIRVTREGQPTGRVVYPRVLGFQLRQEKELDPSRAAPGTEFAQGMPVAISFQLTGRAVGDDAGTIRSTEVELPPPPGATVTVRSAAGGLLFEGRPQPGDLLQITRQAGRPARLRADLSDLSASLETP